jgi:hypothetical protein
MHIYIVPYLNDKSIVKDVMIRAYAFSLSARKRASPRLNGGVFCGLKARKKRHHLNQQACVLREKTGTRNQRAQLS